MIIITVLRKPGDDILIGPVDLECVGMFIIDVVLNGDIRLDGLQKRAGGAANLDGHLIHMNTLFDAEFGDKNVESSVQNVDNASLADNGSVSVGKIGHKETQEKVG